MLTPLGLYTLAELRELADDPANAHKRLELLEGVLYEMSPTKVRHGYIAWKLSLLMGNYVVQNRLGVLTIAETGYILNYHEAQDIVFVPDIGFISQAKWAETGLDDFAPFAPDLAVEVISPGNTSTEINRKVELYLRYGTRLVWILYPLTQTVHVYTATEQPDTVQLRFLNIHDTLTGDEVLPGFAVPLTEIFHQQP